MTFSFEPTADGPDELEFRPDMEEHFEALNPTTAAPEPPVEDEETLRARLREEAFAAGREEALREAAARLEPTVRALQRAAAELAGQRVSWLRAQRGLVVELALSLAERIVGESLAADPERIGRRVASVLEASEPNEPAVVTLSPQDHAAVAGLPGMTPAGGALTLVADPSLAAGDVSVSQGATTIDARISTLLAEARELLAGLESVTEPTEEDSA